MVNTIPITKEGFQELLKEHEFLSRVEIPAIIKRVAEARSHGDLKENAEYHAAREQQSHVQGRIAFLADRISRSQIISIDASKSDVIIFGSKVKILLLDDNEEEEYTLVGAAEAKPVEGKISTTSPIGKSLIGKRIDEVVEAETPGGKIRMKIIGLS